MAELIVRFDVSVGQRTCRGLMAAAMFFSTVPELASESVTLTTYYPAPSGVYAQMITTGNTWLARDGGKVAVGGVTLPSGVTGFAVMNGSVGLGTTDAGTAGLAVMNGNVGIGMNTPNYGIDMTGNGAGGKVEVTQTNSTDRASLFLKNDVGTSVEIAQYGSGASSRGAWLQNGAEALTVANGGNVGIGTTAGSPPATKLDVRGNMVLTGLGGGHGYIHVDNSSTGCASSAATDNQNVCGAGQYATWNPGVYVDDSNASLLTGWQFENLGGQVVVTGNGPGFSTQVWGVNTNNGAWGMMTLSRSETVSFYCCPK
jgi:hypothetical protein